MVDAKGDISGIALGSWRYMNWVIKLEKHLIFKLNV